MSYTVLEKELKTLPKEYLDCVAEYVELLKYKISFLNQNKSPKKLPVISLAKGKFPVPEDIHAYDDEIIDMFGDSVQILLTHDASISYYNEACVLQV